VKGAFLGKLRPDFPKGDLGFKKVKIPPTAFWPRIEKIYKTDG
jgi:hypothetical protein